METSHGTEGVKHPAPLNHTIAWLVWQCGSVVHVRPPSCTTMLSPRDRCSDEEEKGLCVAVTWRRLRTQWGTSSITATPTTTPAAAIITMSIGR
ncbi:hypothetical protein E2C01_067411 [Portunus trituberculatus]|uniref:Uncharacterized protein n=1 Tax=Portunus trituberculatus TaxID=210409 RepID=A0A5B7HSJ4_PORTR|nr:hypothetical protein [Portunus trituberculatus]